MTHIPFAPTVWTGPRPIALLGNVKQEVSGRYRFTIRRPDGTVRHETDWFDNLITDGGLDNVFSDNDWDRFCYVGTGNTPPSGGDTSLVTPVAGAPGEQSVSSSSGHAFEAAFGYAFLTKTYRFDVGEAEGVLSEVGIGPNGSDLTSRALIRDGSNNPTTITVLSDEILDVTFQVRMYHGEDVTVDAVQTLNTADYNTKIRLYRVDQWPAGSGAFLDGEWSFFSITQGGMRLYDGPEIPNWTENTTVNGNTLYEGPTSGPGAGSVTNLPYVGGSYQRDATGVFGFNYGNGAPNGISNILVRTLWTQYMMFWDQVASPGQGIPKDNTNELTINWRWSLARRP